jgi:hypothetical protein
VLVELPRGQAAVELTLTKLGFAPLAYKVIPNQDKDVIARLEPATSAPRLASSRSAAVRPALRSPVALAAASGAHGRGVVAGSVPPRAGASAAPLPPAASPTRPTAAAPSAAATPQQPAVHRPAWSGPSPRR